VKLRDYQRVWQGVAIDELPAVATTSPADAHFYEQFYETAEQREAWKGQGPWIEQKRQLGALIAELLTEHAVTPHRANRILSVGAGYGIVEEVLVERGFAVDLQECQAVSLRSFLRKHPKTGAFVCDARSLSAIDGRYAAVCLIAVEYAFDTPEYAAVFREISRLLKARGVAVLVSASSLQLRDLLLGWPRRLKDRIVHNGKPAVYWGYRRTVDTHVRIAASAGLAAETLLGLQSDSSVMWRRNDPIHGRWPVFTDAPQTVVVFRKT
jgi:SAM-dependent methyltransferase